VRVPSPRRSRRSRSRTELQPLVARHLAAGEPTGWFEPLYVAARRDASAVPWATGTSHPYVVDWLDGPVATPPGRCALVVGAGLGDDAAELARRGYEVTAVDVAPTALAWARRRFRRLGVGWERLDVLDADARAAYDGRFDLVVEVHTVSYLPGVVRDAAMHAIGSLVAPGGVLVVVTFVTTGAHVAPPPGPPWPQSPSELAAYRSAELVRLTIDHPPASAAADGVLEVRLTFQRPRTDGAGP
jgi:SAM-dependent methyltransferase